MNTTKKQTETYLLTELERLDPVSVYVTNYEPGKGKVVIECYGRAWACYWGGMSDNTLQQFLISSDNGYLLNKLLPKTYQNDFDAINKRAEEHGVDLRVESDIEIAFGAEQMEEIFGVEWFREIPCCHTDDYHYLGRILDAVKEAFRAELQEQDSYQEAQRVVNNLPI